MATLTLNQKGTDFFVQPKQTETKEILTYELIGRMMANQKPVNHTPILGFTPEQRAEFDRGISIQDYAKKHGIELI
ncbi:MAG: hypothetical protein LBN95_07265 [Prevotellaceae bacterium]|jgi:hypothetical protein|nr:hypothetical protein [Prevotellaceae bacterium]